MTPSIKEDLISLSIPERLQLIEELWDSITEEPDAIQLSDEQKLELDRRIEDYRNDPGKGVPWEVARKRIKNRK